MTDTLPGPGFVMRMERSFAAPRALVFDCMTRAEHLARWWGPRGFDVPLCESDHVPGGRLVLHMRGPEPYGTNPVEGEFLEVSPPDRLRYVLRGFPGEDGGWGIEHVTTIDFSDAPGGGTLLKMSTEVLQVSDALRPALGGMDQGWSQSLDKLDELLAEIG